MTFEDKTCHKCSEKLFYLGKEFIRSEMNIIPAQMFVVDIYHDAYKCEEYANDEYTPITKAGTLVPITKKVW